jgi:hypothetical protein
MIFIGTLSIRLLLAFCNTMLVFMYLKDSDNSCIKCKLDNALNISNFVIGLIVTNIDVLLLVIYTSIIIQLLRKTKDADKAGFILFGMHIFLYILSHDFVMNFPCFIPLLLSICS